jgi:hypothetical protein
MTDENARQSGDGAAGKPQGKRWLRKLKAVAGFAWWVIKVVDWLLTPRGLNRVEFPQYNGGRDLGDGRIQTLDLEGKGKG